MDALYNFRMKLASFIHNMKLILVNNFICTAYTQLEKINFLKIKQFLSLQSL